MAGSQSWKSALLISLSEVRRGTLARREMPVFHMPGTEMLAQRQQDAIAECDFLSQRHWDA